MTAALADLPQGPLRAAAVKRLVALAEDIDPDAVDDLCLADSTVAQLLHDHAVTSEAKYHASRSIKLRQLKLLTLDAAKQVQTLFDRLHNVSTSYPSI